MATPFIDTFRLGRADKQAREEETRQKRFGELAGTLYGAQDRTPILAEMAQINPQGAMQFGQQFANQDRVRQEQEAAQRAAAAKATLYKANAVRTAPPGRKAAIWQQVAPEHYATMAADGITDEEIDMFIDQNLPQLYADAGMEPPAPTQTQPRVVGRSLVGMNPDGTPNVLYRDPEARQPVAPKPKYQLTDKTMPDGSIQKVRVDMNNPDDPGEPWGAPVQPKASPGEEKARRDARAKIPTIEASLRRIERIEKASDNLTWGGGPLDAKALGLTPSYKELEQAGASLMPTLTALTRVPGIGSQSDLEQRLANLQIPSGDMYPDTRAAAIKELKAFIDDLRAAYMSVAEGKAPMSPLRPNAAQAPQKGGWTVREKK